MASSLYSLLPETMETAHAKAATELSSEVRAPRPTGNLHLASITARWRCCTSVWASPT